LDRPFTYRQSGRQDKVSSGGSRKGIEIGPSGPDHNCSSLRVGVEYCGKDKENMLRPFPPPVSPAKLALEVYHALYSPSPLAGFLPTIHYSWFQKQQQLTLIVEEFYIPGLSHLQFLITYLK